jgi:tRNA pseudouridine38/39 synthase
MEGNPGEKTDYSTWSQGKLIERVTQLEAELKAQNRRSSPFPLISKTEPDGCSV